MKISARAIQLTAASLLSLVSSFAFADNCESIRQQIDRAPYESHKNTAIQIPAGNFVCDHSIIVKKSNLDIHGAGMDKTVLQLKAKIHAPLFIIGDDQMTPDAKGQPQVSHRVSKISLTDLTLDGNVKHHNPSKECGEFKCDDQHNLRNNALTIRGASQILIQNVSVHDAISGGIVTEKICDKIHVNNLKSFGNHFDGFAGYLTTNSLFENMDVSHNRDAGISLDIYFSHNKFSHVKVDGNGDVGIYSRSNESVTFNDVTITNSGKHGVYISDAALPNTCASDNKFNNLIVRGSKGFGFYLGSVCKGTAISGKSIIEQNKQGCSFVAQGAQIAMAKGVICK